MAEGNNSSNQNLTEAQQYYIGLLERWQKMSMDENVKTDNPELWRELQRVKFGKCVELLLKLHGEYLNDNSKYLINQNHYNKEYNRQILKINNESFIKIFPSTYSETDNTFWFKILINLTVLDSTLNKLVLKSLDLKYLHDYEDLEIILIILMKDNRITIKNCINYAELENKRLKNELEIIKKPELSNSKFKIFHFNQDILGEYKASLAEYFMGLKDFILYAQGKNIGVNIEVNGTLDVKIYSDNEQDLEIVKESIQDYIFNLKKTGADLQIHTGAGSKVDGQKALIHLQSKINSLQTSLQLKNSNLLQAKNQLVFLESVIQDLTANNSELQVSNQKLLDDLDYAIAQMDKLKNELTKIKTQNLYKNFNQNHLDNIINLLGSLSLVIEQKNDKGLVKQLVNKLADYEKVNREFLIKINLPEISFGFEGTQINQDFSTINLSDIIQQITHQLYRKF